jgi:hypothetical protein
VFDDGGRDTVERREMMHLLEDFEQHQQTQPGSFAARRAARPFEFVGLWRVAGLQVLRGKDLGKTRIGGALDGGYVGIGPGFRSGSGP